MSKTIRLSKAILFNADTWILPSALITCSSFRSRCAQMHQVNCFEIAVCMFVCMFFLYRWPPHECVHKCIQVRQCECMGVCTIVWMFELWICVFLCMHVSLCSFRPSDLSVIRLLVQLLSMIKFVTVSRKTVVRWNSLRSRNQSWRSPNICTRNVCIYECSVCVSAFVNAREYEGSTAVNREVNGSGWVVSDRGLAC